MLNGGGALASALSAAFHKTDSAQPMALAAGM